MQTMGNVEVGTYDHLNKDTPVIVRQGDLEIRIPMDAVYDAVKRSNYGVHRFLSRLVTDRESDPDQEGDLIASSIRDAMERQYI